MAQCKVLFENPNVGGCLALIVSKGAWEEILKIREENLSLLQTEVKGSAHNKLKIDVTTGLYSAIATYDSYLESFKEVNGYYEFSSEQIEEFQKTTREVFDEDEDEYTDVYRMLTASITKDTIDIYLLNTSFDSSDYYEYFSIRFEDL